MPLVGGERAVREPWRVAVALLARAGCAELIPDLPMSRSLDASTLSSVAGLSNGDGWMAATGAGRLFEACGALLGLASHNRFEGEAAVQLESLASTSGGAEPWSGVAVETVSGVPVIPSSSLIAAAARCLVDGEDAADVAAGFHSTFSALVVEVARRVVGPTDEVVAVGGGCLVNRILRRELAAGLRPAGRDVLLPIQLPAGDGGLAYGQATIGSVVVALGLDAERLEHPTEGDGGL
jgi:hydrogenase maturation protein HypF